MEERFRNILSLFHGFSTIHNIVGISDDTGVLLLVGKISSKWLDVDHLILTKVYKKND